MSEQHEDTPEQNENETEDVEIKLSYTNEKDKENENQVKQAEPTAEHKNVEFKPINELTDEERRIIINNAKAGYDQPNYSVTFFKNGKTRIVKKKAKRQTISEKVIQSAPQTTTNEKKVYYSDNQLMMEHILDLSSKVDRLLAKHKKLKKKYYNLRDDIYVDDNDADNDEHEHEETNAKPNVNSDAPAQVQNTPAPELPTQPIYQQPVLRSSWRSRVTYL